MTSLALLAERLRIPLTAMSIILLLAAGMVGTATKIIAGNAQSSAANQQKPVVELFTSQGCSSCPPADVLLKDYIDDNKVIALSYSVDYWDYLGWKDTLASAANTRRQREYALTRGDRQVYTPQAVINGMTHAVGSRRSSINQAISKTATVLEGKKVGMSLRSEGDKLLIEVDGAPDGEKIKQATIWLALTTSEAKVKVMRGENARRTLSYHNVVRELVPVGVWDGKRTTLKLPKREWQRRGADGCVAFLQLAKTGPILGAAEMRGW